ncbi:element excision factor XisI family protein [Iningainema tapete]|uniref:element excision factor XisI family protein n=1 Tax=Iningainema tapete TaxID=2806730 RepID=UPI002356A9BE|nr:element excision factor XisI family protein [Iningainema tapete]
MMYIPHFSSQGYHVVNVEKCNIIFFSCGKNTVRLETKTRNQSRRVYGSLIHIDLKGDKIWIQYDGTASVSGE